MKIKFVAVIVTILSVVAAFQFAPGANADSRQLAAPGGLAVRQSGTGLLLSWDAVNGAESYNVYQDGQYTATVHPPVRSYSGADLQDASFYVTACAGKEASLRCSATSEAKANGTTWNLAENTPIGYDRSVWPHRAIWPSENKIDFEGPAQSLDFEFSKAELERIAELIRQSTEVESQSLKKTDFEGLAQSLDFELPKAELERMRELIRQSTEVESQSGKTSD